MTDKRAKRDGEIVAITAKSEHAIVCAIEAPLEECVKKLLSMEIDKSNRDKVKVIAWNIKPDIARLEVRFSTGRPFKSIYVTLRDDNDFYRTIAEAEVIPVFTNGRKTFTFLAMSLWVLYGWYFWGFLVFLFGCLLFFMLRISIYFEEQKQNEKYLGKIQNQLRLTG